MCLLSVSEPLRVSPSWGVCPKCDYVVKLLQVKICQEIKRRRSASERLQDIWRKKLSTLIEAASTCKCSNQTWNYITLSVINPCATEAGMRDSPKRDLALNVFKSNIHIEGFGTILKAWRTLVRVQKVSRPLVTVQKPCVTFCECRQFALQGFCLADKIF